MSGVPSVRSKCGVLSLAYMGMQKADDLNLAFMHCVGFVSELYLNI
jgi:hypothetical protein